MSEQPTGGTGRARILVVDDHPVVRQGLASLIAQEPDLEVCGEAESAEEALWVVPQLAPELVLVDLSLRDKPGLELVKQLHARHPGLRILVVSMHEESLWAERVLRAGACGYVMKQERPRVLIARIRQALAGGVCLSDAMADRLLRKVTGQRGVAGDPALDALGDRELEVLQLLGQGLGPREIASSLQISVKTVESHRENLKRKLGLGSGPELLRYAVLRFLGDAERPDAGPGKRGG